MTDASIIEENKQLKQQLKDIQYQFDGWKKVNEPDMYVDDYKTLVYQQMDCIITLRKQLEEREKQCADLFRKVQQSSVIDTPNSEAGKNALQEIFLKSFLDKLQHYLEAEFKIRGFPLIEAHPEGYAFLLPFLGHVALAHETEMEEGARFAGVELASKAFDKIQKLEK